MALATTIIKKFELVWGYLAELGGGFPAILQHIGGAKRAPPDMQCTLYLSNYFGTK